MAEQSEVVVPVVEPVVPVVEEGLTFKQIVDMPASEMREKMAHDESRAEIERVIEEHNALRNTVAPVIEEEIIADDPVLTDEEKAAAQAETDRLAAEAAKAEADKIAEGLRLEAEKKAAEETARLAAEAAKPKQKLVQEYQVRDDDGKPVGNPTHLEADTAEEMIEKIKAAHVNSVLYAERQRKKKEHLEELRKKAEAETVPAIALPTEAEINQAIADLESPEHDVRVNAIKKIALSNSAGEIKKAKFAEAKAEAEKNVYLFLQKHVSDYYRCDANNKLLTDYLTENKLKWTEDNLELAYADLNDRFAPMPRTAPEPVVVPVVEPKKDVVPTPAPEPVVAPVAVVPEVVVPAVPEIPAAPAAPVAPRKIPSGGVEPGSLHGRPQKHVGLTKKDVAAMSGPEFRKRLTGADSAEFKRQLNALGIKA